MREGLQDPNVIDGHDGGAYGASADPDRVDDDSASPERKSGTCRDSLRRFHD